MLKFNNDETAEKLDNNEFDKLLDNMVSTASAMTLLDDIFTQEDNAVGTGALLEFASQMHQFQVLSNSYKIHMSEGTVNLLDSVRNNLNKADAEAGAAIK